LCHANRGILYRSSASPHYGRYMGNATAGNKGKKKGAHRSAPFQR
jgi:hypothetical protein